MPFIGGFRSVGYTQSRRRYPAVIDDVAAVVGTTFVRRDGTSTLTGAWNVGGQDIAGVANFSVQGTLSVDTIEENTPGNGISISGGSVGSDFEVLVNHPDNTNPNSHAVLSVLAGGAVGGDSKIKFDTGTGVIWSIGTDNSDGDKWKLTNSINLGGANDAIVAYNSNKYVSIPYRLAVGQAAAAADLLQVESASRTALLVEDATGIVEYNSRYAQIYVEGASAAQAITTGGTYEKFTGFVTNGDADGATADAANDKITLTDPGYYLVTFQVSYSGTANSTWDFQSRWNGNVQAQLHCTRKLGAGGDVGSCSFCGIIDATSGSTDLEVWMTSDSNGDSMTAQDAQLNATWLGTT